MLKGLLRGALRLFLLLVAVSVLAFALVGASPIDPVRANTGQASYAHMSEEKRAELAEYWGSDRPIVERYLHWAGGVLRGDWGESLRFNRPVATVLVERAGNTALLMLTSWLLSGVLGCVLGVLAGMYRGRAPDRAVGAYCALLSATPTFWLGLVALMVFSVALGWFPFGFSVPVGVDAASVTLPQRLYHMVLPALVLSCTGVAAVALHVREKVIDVLDSEYARFAMSRGLTAVQVVLRHGLRNLMLPVIVLQFAQVGEIFGGSVLVEQVFSYPGLGQAAVTAGVGGDAPLLVGIAVVSAAIVFCGNALADLLCGLLDHRVLREGSGYE